MLKNISDEEAIRIYANDIRKRLIKDNATIRHHKTSKNQHMWLASRGKIVGHGLTPAEALDKLERQLGL